MGNYFPDMSMLLNPSSYLPILQKAWQINPVSIIVGKLSFLLPKFYQDETSPQQKHPSSNLPISKLLLTPESKLTRGCHSEQETRKKYLSAFTPTRLIRSTNLDNRTGAMSAPTRTRSKSRRRNRRVFEFNKAPPASLAGEK